MAGLGSLEVLSVADTAITSLAPVADTPWLRSAERLDLSGTRLDDLTGLERAENVRDLRLYNTPVRDLAPVGRLRRLEVLWLDNTPVSDLSPLAGLSGLRELHLQDTAVTQEQVAALRAAIPGLEVVGPG